MPRCARCGVNFPSNMINWHRGVCSANLGVSESVGLMSGLLNLFFDVAVLAAKVVVALFVLWGLLKALRLGSTNYDKVENIYSRFTTIASVPVNGILNEVNAIGGG